jgi:aryl-alcohol dehydrogenase-like predicted oxidoreductase
MECFAEFQREGKIRYGGVSNFSAQQMKEALETFPITCNQIGYHLFDHRPEPEQFPFCQHNGLGVMAYGSLAHGLLTGAMKPDHKFEEDDWRKSLVAFGQPIFEGEHYQRNLQKVDQLKEIAAGRGMTVAQLALSWVMSNPVISVALVGVRKPSEMEENLKAVDWQMTPEDREELRSIVLG